MQKRKKTEDRIKFTHDERQKMLSKTDGRCARCGVGLTTKTMTAEHIIPISKGGKNEEKNLLALCKTCNSRKDNYVIIPYDYYPYLKESYHKEVMELFKDYICSHRWLHKNNFMPEDKVMFEQKIYLPNAGGKIPKSTGKGGAFVRYMHIPITLEKAQYLDLEEICEYYQKYSKKMVGAKSEGVTTFLETAYKDGAIYVVRKGGEIMAVIPISVKKIEVGGLPFYVFAVANPVMLYQKKEYEDVFVDAIAIITSRLYMYYDTPIFVDFTYLKTDSYMDTIVEGIGIIAAGTESECHKSSTRLIPFEPARWKDALLQKEGVMCHMSKLSQKIKYLTKTRG